MPDMQICDRSWFTNIKCKYPLKQYKEFSGSTYSIISLIRNKCNILISIEDFKRLDSFILDLIIENKYNVHLY